MGKRIEYKEGDIVGNGFIFIREAEPHIDPSGKKRRKAIFICPECKKEVEMKIEIAKTAKTCLNCSYKSLERNNHKIKNKYKKGDIIGNGFVFVKEVKPYISPSGKKYRKAIFICPQCKKEVEERIDVIKKRKVCKQCAIKNVSERNTREYKKGDILYNGFIFVKELPPRITPKKEKKRYIRVICPNCKKENDMYLQSVKRSKSCKDCARKNAEKDLQGKRYNKLTVIKDSGKRTINGDRIWECVCDCGSKTYTRTSDLISGRKISCGCVRSKGEEKISKILASNNINFIKEKNFKTCINPKTQRQLYFDFFLPDYNCCIEYDGEQHFKQHSGNWGGILEDNQYRDEIKNQWCKDHNVNLIRIPYTDLDKLSEKYLMELLERTKIEFITGSTSECRTSEGAKGKEEEATKVHL